MHDGLDLLPLAVQFGALALLRFDADAARLAAVGHLDAVLEGRLGQRLLLVHVVAVLLGRVKVPPAHRALLVALQNKSNENPCPSITASSPTCFHSEPKQINHSTLSKPRGDLPSRT